MNNDFFLIFVCTGCLRGGEVTNCVLTSFSCTYSSNVRVIFLALKFSMLSFGNAITSLGGDVNNTVVVEDPSVAAEHGLLTYRGSAWYLEEREDGMRPMLVNGEPIEGGTPVRFGDEIALGRVRMRLERPLARADA